MSQQMLMLGLDSIDWELMNQWAAEGRLPVLSRLLSESSVLKFDESTRPLPGSVWTDIATGVSAATHGYIHEDHVPSNSYRRVAVDSTVLAAPPFYKTLSDNGINCAVVDFPVDYPLDNFNGKQVVDWGTEFKLWKFETRPEELATSIVSTYGAHPLTGYKVTHISLHDIVQLKRKLQRGIEIKTNFVKDLVKSRDHDFVFFNFAELHKAGHFLWRFHDQNHPDYTEEEPELLHSLRSMYEQIDKAVGEVLEQQHNDDDLIIITDRGMFQDFRGDHLVDQVLTKLELGVPRGLLKNQTSKPSFLSGRAAGRFYRWVGDRLPDGVRELLLPFHRAALGGMPPWDWTQTKVFRMPNVGNSNLRVNIAGVCPNGIVSPGAEYDAVLQQIDSQFRALTNIETGEPAIEDIYFPKRLFSGPLVAELPDITIVWNSNAPINGVTSSAIGTVTGQQVSRRTGNHRPLGFALIRGPSFRTEISCQDADSRQIAPMILKRFGIAVPDHYELEPCVSIAA